MLHLLSIENCIRQLDSKRFCAHISLSLSLPKNFATRYQYCISHWMITNDSINLYSCHTHACFIVYLQYNRALIIFVSSLNILFPLFVKVEIEYLSHSKNWMQENMAVFCFAIIDGEYLTYELFMCKNYFFTCIILDRSTRSGGGKQKNMDFLLFCNY